MCRRQGGINPNRRSWRRRSEQFVHIFQRDIAWNHVVLKDNRRLWFGYAVRPRATYPSGAHIFYLFTPIAS
jgi:hypothetical protein